MTKNPFTDLTRLYEQMDRIVERRDFHSSERARLDGYARWAEAIVDRWILEYHEGHSLDVEAERLFWRVVSCGLLAACAADRYLDALDRGWPPEHRDADARHCPHPDRRR